MCIVFTTLLLEVEACCTSLDNEKIVIKYNIHALPPRGRVLELFSPLGVGDTSFCSMRQDWELARYAGSIICFVWFPREETKKVLYFLSREVSSVGHSTTVYNVVQLRGLVAGVHGLAAYL